MNLVDILQQYRVDFRRAGESKHVRGEWVGVECQWCGKGTGNFGLGLHPQSLACTCWKCGRHGIADVLIELTGEPYRVVKALLDGMPHIRLGEREKPPGTLKLPKGLGPLGERHRRYLKGRGLDPDMLAKVWGLQGIGLAARLSHRIFIPIKLDDRTVSWTTRATTDDVERRYIAAAANEEAMPAKSLVFGTDHCRHAIIVVEGPTDVLRIGPGAGGLLGLAYTKEQVRRIAKFPVRAIVMDNEPEAQRRAVALCRELSAMPGRTTRIEIDAADPGSASNREIRLLRRKVLGVD